MEISQNSKVWIYQADRVFTPSESEKIEKLLADFTAQWQAHGQQLAAMAELRYNRFIILLVDEADAAASGCSIDRSVHLMKQIDQEFGVDLFDRFNIAYRDGDEIKSCGRDEFERLIEAGKITNETIVFNNLVSTKKELDLNWEVPLKNSWHARVFGAMLV